MKTKIIPALLDTADAPMLLINDQVHEWSNARFRDLPEALRTPILTWAQNQDTEWLELEGYRFQRLSAKQHTAIIGYIVDRNRLQRTLLLKLLPGLQAGGDPYQNTAKVLGPLLGWKNCLVAKRKTDRSLEVLGHWQDGKLLPPASQKLIGNAAQGLYEGESTHISIKALCREFPLDELLSETPSALWIGHRIDLPEQNGVGHLCVWGQPEHVDTEATEWLMGLAVDTLSAWLLSQHHAENKDYEPSSEPRDQLTGLPGPKTFDLALTHAASTYQQTQQDFLVALVDIDGLTHINDQYGKLAGDKLIQRFADELLNMCRRRDQVFRLGGDEFLLLMPMTHTPPPVAKRLDRISKQLQADIPEFNLNLSMSTLSEVKGSSEELMLTIDQRLKANKDNHKK
ncbi:GGDEF domain-containing protein [Nitrincola iocasae]|uniref:diguanylate cyclase n=1 Tax=Nitrincola iocasae TaxID=2614693 RepID=A0A5J6LCY5_9GAMM|nr:GGDEF domain-containing protein [Nitrincola iocasae]QEW06296.1 GGDEF domain-containing protein [Nitrincola iocasae]